MGGGSAIRQAKRKLLQGEPVSTSKKEVCVKTHKNVIVFGEYEVHKTENDEYELLKKGIVIGTFSKARIDEEKVFFTLSRGVMLKVSKEGIKEIITPRKSHIPWADIGRWK